MMPNYNGAWRMDWWDFLAQQPEDGRCVLDDMTKAGMTTRELMPATTTENEMRKLHVGTSPLTNRIYAGHVLKDGATWGEGKQDVTGAACGAVCEHVLANGEPVMVTCNGKPKYEITVREL